MPGRIRTALCFAILPLLTLPACSSREEVRTSSENAEAQSLYERARVLEQQRLSVEDLRNAEDLYRKAIALDQTFASAHAGLARIHAAMVHFMYEPTDERRNLSRDAAQTALKLQPSLGDAHYAMGTYWYWGLKQYDKAAAEFDIAAKSMPESGEVQGMAGAVLRRRGDWRQALTFFERAAQVNPRAVDYTELGDTYAAFGRLSDSRQAYDSAQRAAPDSHYEVGAALIQLRHEGLTEPLRIVLNALPADYDPDGNITSARYELAWVQRRPDEALQALSRTRRTSLETQFAYSPIPLLAARAHRLARRTAEARAAFSSARATLEPMAAERPNDARILVALAGALAGLGESAAAVEAASRALSAMPREKDALIAQHIARQAAAVYADVGEADRAVALLQSVFAEEAVFEYSRRYLTLDPHWDKLRKNGRFQSLAATGS